jgi:hypothetical protein
MSESDGGDVLYEIDVQTAASPEEVFRFTELLESEGYRVVTDLEYGKIKLEEGDDE